MLTANTFLCVTQVIMSEAIGVDSLLALVTHPCKTMFWTNYFLRTLLR